MSDATDPNEQPSGGKKRGCLIAVALVAGIGLVTCGGGAFWLVNNGLRMAAWGLEKQQPQIMQAVDGDVDDALREELRSEIAAQVAMLQKLNDTDIEKPDMERAMAAFLRLQESLKDKSISAVEVREFLEHSRSTREAFSAGEAP